MSSPSIPSRYRCEARVVELKNKCEAIERREAERRAVDERKRKEEIDFLKPLGAVLAAASAPHQGPGLPTSRLDRLDG